MANEVLEFAKLLAPIPGGSPTGVDLRTDTSPTSLYYATKDARSKARAAERQMVPGDEQDASTSQDWKPVYANACKALAEKSKDLEITAYLIEALIRLNGFAGLRDGLRLARELVEKYWDGLFPVPDEEDGILTRVAPLTGLNGDDSEGTLMGPIGRVKITEPTNSGHFTKLDCQQALAVKRIADPKARDKKIAEGALAPDVFDRAVAESSAKFYKGMVQQLTECSAELTKLGAILDKNCGTNAPPTSAIREALESYLATVKEVAKVKLEEPDKPAPGATAAAGPGGTPAAAGSAGPVESRESAFKTLSQVADFFRRTEPHSMVSYALEQVVRWGRMPLPDLLSELIAEEPVRKALFKQVGIRPPEPPPKEPAKK